MPTDPEPIERSDLEALLGRWAGCAGTSGGKVGFQTRVIADYIRQALCRFAPAGLPVHVHRLLPAVRSQLRDLFPVTKAPWWIDPETDDDAGAWGTNLRT